MKLNALSLSVPAPRNIADHPDALECYRDCVIGWAGDAFDTLPQVGGPSDDEFATRLRARIAAHGRREVIERLLNERADLVANQVRAHIRPLRVLDCGCGDGRVASRLAAGLDFTLADLVRPGCTAVESLPFVPLIDGEDLPFADASFDTCLLLTVLHHAEDPVRVLRNALRVSRRVVIIESVVGAPSPDMSGRTPPPQEFARASRVAALSPESQRAFAVFTDFVYNRCIFSDVPVPYNFNTPDGWIRLIESLGSEVTVSQPLGVDQVLVPEVHHLLVANVR